MSRTRSRSVLTAGIFIIILAGWCVTIEQSVYAAGPQASKLQVEIASLSISPASVPAGSYPEIQATVRNTSKEPSSRAGKAAIDVKLVLTLPDKTTQQWMFRNNKFSADRTSMFSAPKEYATTQAGAYKIECFVYPAGGTRVLASRSESFTVVEAAKPAKAAKKEVSRDKAPANQSNYASQKSASPSPGPSDLRTGLGLHVNAINFSVGPAVVFWPLEKVGVEAFFGAGRFTTYGVRGINRLRPLGSLKPYIGVGYLHAEAYDTLRGRTVSTRGDSLEIFAGLEHPLSRNLTLYLEASATPLKLKNANITSGQRSAHEDFNYSPVTVNAGILWYLF